MNLIFKTLRFKNFLSYGNAMTEIHLNRKQLVSIQGQNGAGKSSIVSALIFGLYGKSQNKVLKGKMINSINGKNLLVEVEYERNGHEYLVRRGMKPNVFEVYQDGNLVTQDSAVADYQEVFETQHLGISYKNFLQLVVVGSSSYMPFMDLSALDKRNFIENVLDVSILTVMNQLAKAKAQNLDNTIQETLYRRDGIKTAVRAEQSVIKSLENVQQKNTERLQEQIREKTEQVAAESQKVSSCMDKITKAQSYVDGYEVHKQKKRDLEGKVASIKSEIAKLKKDNAFVLSNDYCPMCHQSITDDHKNSIRTNMDGKIAKAMESLDTYTAELTGDVAKTEESYEKFFNTLNSFKGKVNTSNSLIRQLNRDIKTLTEELNAPEQNDTAKDIENHKNKVIEYAKEYRSVQGDYERLLSEKDVLTKVLTLLKDSGIKTSVVNQYLPIINKTINRYLQEMDFFISFSMDSEFKEVIRARERDEFNYYNLSQGERKRLDLAILFTWRYVSSVRNSCSTNLLVLDETDDGLDGSGSEAVMKLLRSFTGSNIFVISHKEQVQDGAFDGIIAVKKQGQFSVITEV